MGRIVDLPLVHTISGVPRRSHNERFMDVVEMTPIGIHEVAEADLQPVLSVDATVVAHIPVRLHYKGFGGRLYCFDDGPLSDNTPLEAVEQSCREMLETPGRSRDLPYPINEIAERWSLEEGWLRQEDVHRLRSLSFSDEERSRAAMLERAAQCLVVDGRLMLPAEEPCWTVGAKRLNLHRGSLSKDSLGFRFDRLEEAREYGIFKHGDEPAPDRANLEVHADWDWSFDETGHNARRMRDQVEMQWLHADQRSLMQASPEFFAAWCRFRDAKDHETLIESVDALVHVMQADPQPPALMRMVEPATDWLWMQRSLPDRRLDAAAALGDLRI